MRRNRTHSERPFSSVHPGEDDDDAFGRARPAGWIDTTSSVVVRRLAGCGWLRTYSYRCRREAIDRSILLLASDPIVGRGVEYVTQPSRAQHVRYTTQRSGTQMRERLARTRTTRSTRDRWRWPRRKTGAKAGAEVGRVGVTRCAQRFSRKIRTRSIYRFGAWIRWTMGVRTIRHGVPLDAMSLSAACVACRLVCRGVMPSPAALPPYCILIYYTVDFSNNV